MIAPTPRQQNKAKVVHTLKSLSLEPCSHVPPPSPGPLPLVAAAASDAVAGAAVKLTIECQPRSVYEALSKDAMIEVSPMHSAVRSGIAFSEGHAKNEQDRTLRIVSNRFEAL